MVRRYPSRRTVLQAASLIGIAGFAGTSGRSAMSALAQERTGRSRSFIQFSAGGGTDTVTRTLLKAMEQSFWDRSLTSIFAGQ